MPHNLCSKFFTLRGVLDVAIDAHGRSLYDEQTASAQARRDEILAGLAQARKTALPPTA